MMVSEFVCYDEDGSAYNWSIKEEYGGLKMIYTVRGPIHKRDLGITLGHEHFKWETDEEHANNMYFDKKYREDEIDLDTKAILPILLDIKSKGGKSIVEASPPIGGQNVRLLKALSEEADMHIIPCTGWNITRQLYEVFPLHFEEQMATRWVKDFKEGLDTINGVVIRPAYIKLLLTKGELTAVDRGMIIAAVKASKESGMPIHCHILEAKMVHEVIEVLEAEKADYNKFLWAHADEEYNLETIKVAAGKGMWIGIDNVRAGLSQEKFELLKQVISLGYGHKVLLSQDYDFYTEAKKSIDTHPCTVIFDEFMPYCAANGINPRDIMHMMTENPANFYDNETIFDEVAMQN